MSPSRFRLHTAAVAGASLLVLTLAACGVTVIQAPSAGSGVSSTTTSMGTTSALGAESWQDMDSMMQASIKAFPAKTSGVGAQPLQPTILPDGTKQFRLVTRIVPWEVSPGKAVEAWTYNGMVPGPTIQVNVGDKVQVVLHNELPESTSIHFHGVQTPANMDGTTFVAQPPVTPGADFTYSFTPHQAAVGMYHSHHDAVKQVANGLFGAFLVGEMPVPSGITVTGGNQIFALDDAGVLGLTFNGKSFPATAPYTAKLGQWIEVTYFNAGMMIHPIHLHEFPQLVIAADGYPLAEPYYKDTIDVGPGERYTVLINANVAGVWVWHCHILSHAENAQGMTGMVTALVVQ